MIGGNGILLGVGVTLALMVAYYLGRAVGRDQGSMMEFIALTSIREVRALLGDPRNVEIYHEAKRQMKGRA